MKAELGLDQLTRTLAAHELDFLDPIHGKRKRYRAFRLAELLDAAYGKTWREAAFTEAAFRARDGYEAVAELARLSEPDGFVAFADLDAAPAWEPIGSKGADPGPFYLVWTGKDHGTQPEYPWPWQLREIELVRFRERYPGLFPEGAAEGSAALRGYRLFKDRCVRCHAMDQEGGKVGPDLNAPRSIVEYRSPRMIKEFIRNPSEYRYSRMPDHRELRERDLDDLVEYFRFKSRDRKEW